MNVISVPLDQYKTAGYYECPMYVTSMRGPTWVTIANIKMESEDSEQSKWVLSGACLLMSDD